MNIQWWGGRVATEDRVRREAPLELVDILVGQPPCAALGRGNARCCYRGEGCQPDGQTSSQALPSEGSSATPPLIAQQPKRLHEPPPVGAAHFTARQPPCNCTSASSKKFTHAAPSWSTPQGVRSKTRKANHYDPRGRLVVAPTPPVATPTLARRPGGERSRETLPAYRGRSHVQKTSGPKGG